METDTPPKPIRASITEAYHARVDETKAKQGKTKPVHNDNDVEEELLEGTLRAPSGPAPSQSVEQAEAPLLSLRDLMPEEAQNTDPHDRSLDAKFRANRIEFVLVSRKATTTKIETDAVLQEVSDMSWEIPEPKEYFEVMGKATSRYTDKDKTFIHGLS